MQMRLLIGVCLVFVAAEPLWAAPMTPEQLARRMDQLLAERFKIANVKPAPIVDDATFLRRVSLDLIGRIPSPYEIHTFIQDASPDKRSRLIAKLLKSNAAVTHFSHFWRALLLPEASANLEMRFLQPGFESWLRSKLKDNTSYDKIAYELITTPIGTNQQATPAPFSMDARANPMAFYTAKESKPENLAAATAKVFLGVQIECAQCHNHPFAKWSREQFWGLAAFYGGLERRGEGNMTPVREVLDRRELAIPNTDRVVQATFLDDKEPEWKYKTSARVTLADWITSPDNPWFAKTLANRMWGHFFGYGIVDPVDDFNDENQPTHPELLDLLAKAFVESKFDLHFIMQAITNTEAYQRSSAMTDPSQQDPRLFARMPVRGLTGEQFFSSLVMATGYRGFNPNADFLNNGVSNLFIEQFALPGRKVDSPTSILQALTLMNGSFLADATSLNRSETLTAICEMPLLTTEERVDALYLTTLSRKPNPEEKIRVMKHLNNQDKAPLKQKLSDVLWVLLNSAEFRLNH